MYVCICNGIKDKQVRKAVKNGAETVGRVFKAHGCKPECGQCVGCMRSVIQEEVSPAPELMAAE